MVDIPGDIPKYIRYDFFMALLGIIVAYFLFTNDRVYASSELRILFTTISAACIMYGLFEMKNNYEREKETRELKSRVEKFKLVSEIKKMRE